ncbi:MAG: aminoglycoside 6-adenylyltransferase [Clostridium sp.]|jgi:aminoglycoside 6-adenylyltransferase|nr:aminoglycoside 6-adenylyltransferase [Clostridium sp.]
MGNDRDIILQALLGCAKNDENIRAVLMEGSRAFGAVDEYSDYDIVYVTRSNEPYFDGAILPFLINNFGDIAVMQTPDNGDPHDVYTHLIQFASGVRIDLTFNSLAFLSKTPFESATIILLDKDVRYANAAPPSDADFWLKHPSEEEFCGHCNQFWWCSPYVAKAVAREQLLHALELLSEGIRAEYAVMLSYLAGARNNWNKVNVGKHGCNIKNALRPDDWKYYEVLMNSYVRADNKEITLALNELMKSYQPLAAAVAKLLGYTYDPAEAKKTMRFIAERFAV